MKPKYFQEGFAVVPIVIVVALVGLMVPTVKYVTDPENSFDTRSFARVSNYMVDGVGSVTSVVRQAQKSSQKESAADITKRIQDQFNQKQTKRNSQSSGTPNDLNTVVQQESKQKESKEESAETQRWQGLADKHQEQQGKDEKQEDQQDEPDPQTYNPSSLNAVVKQESKQKEDKVTESEDQEEEKTETAAEITARLQQEFNQKKAEEQSAGTPDNLADIIQQETRQKQAIVQEQNNQKWLDYGKKQVVGQDAYDKEEEEEQRQEERNRIQQHLDQAQTHPDPSPKVYTYDTTSPDLTEQGQEALADLNQIDCTTLTGQARSACLAAVENEMRTAEDALIAFGRGLNTITYGAFGDYLETQVEKNQEYGYGAENYNYWDRALDLESIGSAVAPAAILTTEGFLLGSGVAAVAGSTSVGGAVTALATSPYFTLTQSLNTLTSSGYQATNYCDEDSEKYDKGSCFREIVNIATASIDTMVQPANQAISKLIQGRKIHADTTGRYLRNTMNILEPLTKVELVSDIYGFGDACLSSSNEIDQCIEESANLILQGIITKYQP